MNTFNYYIPAKTLAQLNYGESGYGTQVYGCEDGTQCVVEENVTAPGVDAGAPNTGVFGMSQSAAVATTAGALLVAVAIIGVIFVLVSRARRNKVTKG